MIEYYNCNKCWVGYTDQDPEHQCEYTDLLKREQQISKELFVFLDKNSKPNSIHDKDSQAIIIKNYALRLRNIDKAIKCLGKI